MNEDRTENPYAMLTANWPEYIHLPNEQEQRANEIHAAYVAKPVNLKFKL